jgi:hypothetical protein
LHIWIYATTGIECSLGRLARRGSADGAGAETSAGTVGDGGVKGGADDGNVVGGGGGEKTFYVGEVCKGGYAGEGVLEFMLD